MRAKINVVRPDDLKRQSGVVENWMDLSNPVAEKVAEVQDFLRELLSLK
jgi:hypothetical protein